jgi:hypothetical protein
VDGCAEKFIVAKHREKEGPCRAITSQTVLLHSYLFTPATSGNSIKQILNHISKSSPIKLGTAFAAAESDGVNGSDMHEETRT